MCCSTSKWCADFSPDNYSHGLTHDWATTDDDDYEMECHCGASNCRKVITGQDWRRKDLQEKYGNYLSWYLLEKIKRIDRELLF